MTPTLPTARRMLLTRRRRRRRVVAATLPVPHLLLALGATAAPILAALTHQPLTIKLDPLAAPGDRETFTSTTTPAAPGPQTRHATRRRIRAAPARQAGHVGRGARAVPVALLVAAPVAAAAALDEALRRVPPTERFHFATAEFLGLVGARRQRVLDLAGREGAAVGWGGAGVAVGGSHVFGCGLGGGAGCRGCGAAWDVEDVEGAAGCGLDDVVLFWVVGHAVCVEDVVVPVAGAGEEGGRHEAEGAFEGGLGGRGWVAG